MKDQIRGKVEELRGKLRGDKGEEMKGRLRQAVGNAKSTARDVREDMREEADRRWRNREADPAGERNQDGPAGSR